MRDISCVIMEIGVHSCIGMIDGSKLASRCDFGVLREFLVQNREVYFFGDPAFHPTPSGGELKVIPSQRGVWMVNVTSSPLLNSVAKLFRQGPFSCLAILIRPSELEGMFARFTDVAVLTNPGSGIGRRVQRFAKFVRRRHGSLATATFDPNGDVVRLYYDEDLLPAIATALEVWSVNRQN